MTPALLSIALFGIIAATALIVGVLFAWAWRRHRRPALLLAAVLWTGYGLWEATTRWIAPDAGFRTAPLLVCPLLLLAAVLGVLSLRRPPAAG